MVTLGAVLVATRPDAPTPSVAMQAPSIGAAATPDSELDAHAGAAEVVVVEAAPDPIDTTDSFDAEAMAEAEPARDAAREPAPAPRRPPSFAAELALLEQARRDVESDPRAALATLRRYAREHPRGRLRIEAEAIRIEALAQAGRRAEARRLAERFLRAHPRAPYVERVRDVAER